MSQPPNRSARKASARQRPPQLALSALGLWAALLLVAGEARAQDTTTVPGYAPAQPQRSPLGPLFPAITGRVSLGIGLGNKYAEGEPCTEHLNTRFDLAGGAGFGIFLGSRAIFYLLPELGYSLLADHRFPAGGGEDWRYGHLGTFGLGVGIAGSARMGFGFQLFANVVAGSYAGDFAYGVRAGARFALYRRLVGVEVGYQGLAVDDDHEAHAFRVLLFIDAGAFGPWERPERVPR